jgi:ribosomal-protein-alanine N-acetyltransferase
MPDLVAPVVPAGRMREREQPVLRAGGELTLRPWRPADAEQVMTAYADPAIQRWNLQILASMKEAQAWIAQWQERWRAETDGCWAVTRGSTAEVLGRVALRKVSLSGGRAQCTYWVLPAARGRGVAASATAELARWALDDLGLHRLEIMHSVANPPSCRVASKAGFTLEGTLRSALLHPDGWHDVHLHARLRGDA